jgi:hypothetical protein
MGTGGTTSTGGTTLGTGGTTIVGGTTSSGYSCGAGAITPANPTSGGITDFTDWNSTTNRWGSSTGLNGTVFSYAATSNATMTIPPKVEGSTPGLHLTGSSSSTGYAGGGLTFLQCVKSTGFTKISFQVYGNSPGCNIELQLQTYDKRPTDATPPGGCTADCYASVPSFPSVVSLSSAVAAPGTVVTKNLSDLTNWSAAAATQLVAIQWQFTGSSCTINATFTNIKFLP